MLKLYNLRQISQVALHREHTVYNDKLDSLVWQILEHTLKIVHIVVLIVQLCGKRQTASVYDARMVAVVADDIVATSYHYRKNARVYKETCREAQCLVLTDVFGKFLLELHVQVESTIEETATGTARTILVQSRLCSVNNTLVASKTSISI